MPPTTAASHCPVRIALSAWSRARRLDEQAVSTAKLGPAMNVSHSVQNGAEKTGDSCLAYLVYYVNMVSPPCV